MREPYSSYYPERAPKWRLGLPVHRLKRWLKLDALPKVAGTSWSFFLLSLFIPSMGFWARLRRDLAMGISGITFFLLLFYLAALGSTLGNVSFGLIMAIHATGILFIVREYVIQARLGYRLALICTVLFALHFALYSPTRDLVQSRLLMPAQINGRVVVLNCMAGSRSIGRNDWVVFYHGGGSRPQLYMQDGYGESPVYGLPGDHVRFTPASCVVNGVPQPRRQYMPISGELHVPRQMWFVWPQVVVHYGARPENSQITELIMSRALVMHSDFIGKPFKRWFWRKQIPQ